MYDILFSYVFIIYEEEVEKITVDNHDVPKNMLCLGVEITIILVMELN